MKIRSDFWYTLIVVGLFLVMAADFYLFSRFTVDDAFITWRYARNFIETGIWGYNPTGFDITQAYTNPIFAALALVPAALGLDFVLFFKLIAIASGVVFAVGMVAAAANRRLAVVLTLALLALPATFIHAFSGLETFLYASFLGLFFIAVQSGRTGYATLLASILVFTRPEAWLLAVLLPGYYLFGGGSENSGSFARYVPRVRNFVANHWITLAPLVLLVPYFVFNAVYFGELLPNTFYVKSGSSFSPSRLLKYFFFILPVVLLFRGGRGGVGILVVLYFVPVALNYATSNLQMDYAQKFAFQIFFPIATLLAHVAASESRTVFLSFDEGFGKVFSVP